MKLTKELAEISGMFAADGSMQEDHICMWGNIYEDKEYYDKIVCQLFSKVFNKEIKAHEKPSNSVYGFYICDKKIIEKFKELEFTKNKTYTVRAPKIILKSNNKEIIAAFIRGFTDCDGCLNFVKRYEKGYSKFKRKYHSYPRIFIKVVSEKMIEDLSYLLKKIKIEHNKYIQISKKINEKDVYVIAVRGKERVEKWIENVGFNNPSKFSKYLIWKKVGFCPTPSKYSQRVSILNGIENPHDSYRN